MSKLQGLSLLGAILGTSAAMAIVSAALGGPNIITPLLEGLGRAAHSLASIGQ